MSIEQKVPMSRTSITMVVVVLLCAAGFAYSQGWFNWSGSNNGIESNTIGTEQSIDQVEMKDDAAPDTRQTTEPAAKATE